MENKNQKIPLSILERFDTIIHVLGRPLNKNAKLELAGYVRDLKKQYSEESK